ncbi:MAG: hypothetical protein M3014_08905 [Chloroflexota bacterium]|nr:hypothetical protein [Chloroflexota bacterium]
MNMKTIRSTSLKRALLLGAVALTAAGSTSFAGNALAGPQAASQGSTTSSGPTTGYLSADKLTIKSAKLVDLNKEVVAMPLHRGSFNGQTVWFLITDASDFGLAHDLDANYAPKLANMAIGCPQCVQEVTLSVPADNKFNEAVVNFQGIPDFSPQRILKPGMTGFPADLALPGAVGDAKYSPFIRIQGSSVVYNAPIVATGDGPYDVTHHTNTSDRVLSVDLTAGNEKADMLFIRGFDSGQPIIYLSTEASDPTAATLERATFVPLLQKSPFLGGDDFLGSARERIFPFANGQTGKNNPQAQGFAHNILDAYGDQDASADNTDMIAALRNGGDSLNTQGDFPTQSDPRHANAYSPLWDAQVGVWTPAAIAKGVNTRQNDENQILKLAVDGLITGPGGAPYGSAGFVINCPVVGFLNRQPIKDLVPNPLSK